MRRAFSFLTPFGPASVPTAASMNWFPVVGAAIGLVLGGLWWLADRAWPALVGAAVVVAADAVLTGGLHLDGLVDAADGLLPPLDRARRLEVMADPTVGAFGAVALAVVIVLRFAALASARSEVLVIGALWCGSRTAMAVVARTVPYVRPGGLATAFVSSPVPAEVPLPAPAPADPAASGLAPAAPGRWRAVVPVAVALPLVVGLAFVGRRAQGLAAVAAEVVGVAVVVLLARRRLGGFTGDVLGAAGVVGETVGLLVLAAKW